MALRHIDGKSQTYHLIAYDRKGREQRDEDGSVASAAALKAIAAPGVTDVFVLSHGWQGDYQDAISQYDRWVGAANPDTDDDDIRPVVVGLHWPSKAWSNRELTDTPSGLLGDEPSEDSVTVDQAVDEFAAQLGDDPQTREALRTVLTYAASVPPDQDASAGDALPADVSEAYRSLVSRLGAAGDDGGLLSGGWDPDVVFDESVTAAADDGLLGGGVFSRLREAVLTPLRQLTFWSGKNHAREFGEGAAADFVRKIMRAADVRIHLMGHSFGTIVMAGAVRGPGEHPTPPPRPVNSLFLVQGAVSLWAFTEDAPSAFGGGRGYFADVLRPEFVSGPVVVTRSSWDYAVGKFYPLAVKLAGQFLLGDDEAPKYGGIGTFGIKGVGGAVELPALAKGARTDPGFAPGKLYNIDASGVISHLDGASGAHNDVGHSELTWIAWNAAKAGR
ncbi:hypothetical protein G5T42_14875 [Microbacterium sp. 4R-513]|uniref:hypothetical protein n=1 Tax=Microbacterium sp. 4R-513 TaxID=2567934 RepID=UPI0013E17E7E|nr:hypothetical protein [Microbacterium sp. 4R-513]QIG40602.1 hypothetical protein G5T42_14875 [Microbacterium sp. 4R-513]